MLLPQNFEGRTVRSLNLNLGRLRHSGYYAASAEATTLPQAIMMAGRGPGQAVWRCPAPTPRTPAQRNPSMGVKDHIKRGIPNLNLSRPLFPEGDVSI
jgi:hypothetical protein